MRIITLLFALLLQVSIVSCQETKKEHTKNDKIEASGVPDAVAKAFIKKYPGENDPDWDKDAHGNWEAHFKIDGEKYRADYAADGSWIETENSIKKSNLPKPILEAIKKNYSDREITEVEHVTSAIKGEFYDVEFKQKGKNMDVEFKADGTIINQ